MLCNGTTFPAGGYSKELSTLVFCAPRFTETGIKTTIALSEVLAILSINFNIIGSINKTSIGPSITAIGHIGKNDAEAPASQPTNLGVPWHDIVDNPSIFSLLSWHCKTSKFGGREKEISELYRWAMGSPNISIKFICGEGGTGKSRLAAEFAQSLHDNNWEAGFINLRKKESFFINKEGTLLILDYPEENHGAVSELLKDIAMLSGKLRLRVLFLTRQNIDKWIETINLCNASDIVDMEPLLPGKLNNISAHMLYNSALEKFSDVMRTCPPPISEEVLSDWLKQAPENSKALFILSAALHSSIYPEEEIVRYNGRKVIEQLVNREIYRLRNIAMGRKSKDSYLFARITAMAAMVQEIPVSYINNLNKDIKLHLGFKRGVNVKNELEKSGLLSKGIIAAPKPDIVAAAFTQAVLGINSQAAPEIIWLSIRNNIELGLQCIARLSYDSEIVLEIHEDRISKLFSIALKDRPERCMKVVNHLSGYLPVGLVDAAIVTYRTLLKVAEEVEQKCSLLHNLSISLREAGDRTGALDTIRKAVETRRRLAATNSARYEPDLANSLNTLSNCLVESGDRTGALDTIREAVEIRRRLAATDSARYDPELAFGLHSLSNCLSEAGDRTGALDTIREAVGIDRRLAATNPARYDPDLALSLNTLSNHLGEAGDRKGALDTIREAVGIYRCLADANPARYEPDLAGILNNLSNCLGEAGDRAGALDTIHEAAGVYRRLAVANPARYDPDLAMSLHNLSDRISKAGDRTRALDVIREAVEIRRRLAVANPARYDPDLAMSLHNLSDRTSKAGDRTGALDAIREAVGIYRRLAATNSARYDPDLALSLHTLSNCLIESGDRTGALDTIREAVEIRRRFAAANPARYDPDLALSLNTLSNCLSETGDRTGAIEAKNEAVELTRRVQ
jgi:tetratricopeptide (TPR) repeat protein